MDSRALHLCCQVNTLLSGGVAFAPSQLSALLPCAGFTLEESARAHAGRRRTSPRMQTVVGDVPWQTRIGAAQSRAQSSSSGHTFLLYLCSKLDLLLLLSAVGNSLSEGLFLSLSLRYLSCLLVSDSLAHIPPDTPPHFLSLP